MLDEVQDAPIDNALGHHGHQFGVRNAVKYFDRSASIDLLPTAVWLLGAKAVLLYTNPVAKRFMQRGDVIALDLTANSMPVLPWKTGACSS